jgi:hypothetical protein
MRGRLFLEARLPIAGWPIAIIYQESIWPALVIAQSVENDD